MNLGAYPGKYLTVAAAVVACSLVCAGQVLAQQPDDTAPAPKSYQSAQNGSFLNPFNTILPRLERLENIEQPTQSNSNLEGFIGGYGRFFAQPSTNAFTSNQHSAAGSSSYADYQDESENTLRIAFNTDSSNSEEEYSDTSSAQNAFNTPVHLIADKVTVTEDSIKAEGNASIDVMGARMLCNYFVLDKTTGKVTAVGECIVYWNNNFVAADWLTYDPNGQVTVMHNVTGQGHDFSTNENSNIDGDVFFWADTLQWTKEKMVLTDSTFTTCDKPTDELDYKFVSKYVEIYPNDKLVASNTAIYLKDKRLYTMPTLNVPLDNQRRAQNSIIPQIGSNSVDGWFARNTFDYVFNNDNYGQILLDYYSKTGIGTGIRHYYSLGDKGGGDFYYYRLNGAKINQRLIENIFFKNSPLHDGAMVVSNKRIMAAGCILPVSHNLDIPKELGLRHRAALGISQSSDAIAVIVSEETGRISVAIKGEFKLRLSAEELESILTQEMI